jgi:hypothetical protein
MEEEYRETLARFEAFEQSSGEITNYMDTLTQAKDLEAVRLAIGEGGLNYCKLLLYWIAEQFCSLT